MQLGVKQSTLVVGVPSLLSPTLPGGADKK